MARSFQEQSRIRKFVYIGVALVLFIGMVIHRGFVDDSANRNDLQEIDLGDVDLGGSAARYALVSMRGPLITGLWWEAIERQKKHEWDKLELLVRTLTKLQPHFRKPWSFQAWNVAYNVSVEFDRIEDKYFYIAEGIQWLVEGEEKNRAKVFDEASGEKRERGDPNLRWEIGHMIQNKMTVSDEKKTHQVLFQLSCIRPENRDPDLLEQNPQLLAEFKRTRPRLMRKIRDLRHVPEGMEVQLDRELLSILRTYRRIPYYAVDDAESATADTDQSRAITKFPIWPEGLAPGNPESEEAQDACEVAYNWYVYSQEPLPPPDPVPGPVKLPSKTQRMYRAPEGMSIFIFRAKPAQTKSWKGIYLAQEGWPDWSQEAWEEANSEWGDYARDNGLRLSPEQFFEIQQHIAAYQARYGAHIAQGLPPTEEMQADPVFLEGRESLSQLSWRDKNRSLGNYDHWEIRAAAESDDATVAARYHFYKAANRFRSDLLLSKAEYFAGLSIWEDLSTRPHTAFLLALGSQYGVPVPINSYEPKLFDTTMFGRDTQLQEDAVEVQHDYLWVRAKVEAPDYLHAGFTIWDLGRLMAGNAVPGGLPLPAITTYPAMPTINLNLEIMEFKVSEQDGPLDSYLDPSLKEQIEKRAAPRPEGVPAEEEEHDHEHGPAEQGNEPLGTEQKQAGE